MSAITSVCMQERDKETEKEEKVYVMWFSVCVYLGSIYVVLQRVNEEVSDRLPGVSHPLCLLQSHCQLLHCCLDLE